MMIGDAWTITIGKPSDQAIIVVKVPKERVRSREVAQSAINAS
jgi:hypothetical protein